MLVVQVAAEAGANSDTSRKRTLELTAALADQVYALCPWADPVRFAANVP